MAEYEAVVIGAGTAGEGVVDALHSAGMKVAVVEKELIGGLCAYWGCMPSKTMLRPGDVAWEAQHSAGTQRPKLDWPQISSYRNYMVRDWDDSKQVAQYKEQGVDFLRGTATITGPHSVQVDSQTLLTERIVIATGTEATAPPIPGLAEVGYWTNREATETQVIPESLIVVGGGAVGCELGQAFRHFGSEVTIVEAAPQLLPAEDEHAARYLEEQFRADGIQVHVGRKTVQFDTDARGVSASLDDGTSLSVKTVLVATGRHPQVEGLGLEAVGIKPSRKGVEVDEHSRAAENVWAVGDVTGVAGFTHVASYQAEIAAADILGKSRSANYAAVPRITFTDPEVASVGLVDPAKAPNGMEVITAKVDLEAAARTSTYGRELRGGLCLLANRRQRTLVGAWAVGPLAGEWIQWAALAVHAQVPIDVLEDTILGFPTFTRLYYEPIRRLQSQL